MDAETMMKACRGLYWTLIYGTTDWTTVERNILQEHGNGELQKQIPNLMEGSKASASGVIPLGSVLRIGNADEAGRAPLQSIISATRANLEVFEVEIDESIVYFAAPKGPLSEALAAISHREG